MTMLAVYWRTGAKIAYLTEYLKYEEIRVGLGDDFELCVEAVLDGISSHPRLCRVISRNVKRRIVRRYPYLIYYLVKRRTIEVIGFRHARMRPKKRFPK
jgi:toxin ParE1/3/4